MTDVGSAAGPSPAAASSLTAEYDRYAIVAFAPTFIVEDLRKVRNACPPSGVPVLDAHVTVKRGFDPPLDEAAVLRHLRQAVQGFPAFQIRSTTPEVLTGARSASVVLPLEDAPQLTRLHGRIVEALAPLVGRSTGDEAGAFRPHVTVVQDIAFEGIEQAVRAVSGWRFNASWTVRDVDLVGRYRGQVWRSLGRVDFGRP